MHDFKMILDSPSENPALGFDQTALALKEIITESKPQFVIGIFGAWGSGKTTLMRAIERQLDSSGAIAVQFSAWRYEREPNLVIPLLDVVRESLMAWSDTHAGVGEKAISTASTVGKAVYSLLAGLSFKVGIPDSLEISYKANESLAQAKALGEQEKAARIPRSFYHAAFRALGDAFKEFLSGTGTPDRIVVFVDDLDRCLPQGALDVLEAMKLFFDLPGFVFVVGLDTSIVERSIDLKYRGDVPSSGTDAAVQQIRGAEYIKKIFQVPFSIAPVAIAQLDEFLTAIYTESALPAAQTADFQTNVAPHLRFVVAEAGVNPREIKRFLNVYTLSIKIKPGLDRNTVLALQTIAFRRDWEPVRRAILSYREIFTDVLNRQVSGVDPTAITDLDPGLSGLPESFFTYVSDGNPGAALRTAQNLDEHIYSGEATISSFRPVFFLDAIRDVAQITKFRRELSTGSLKYAEYSAKVSAALSKVKEAGGVRFSGVVGDWLNHLSTGSRATISEPASDAAKQWFFEEETFVRRVMNQLMESYNLGSTAIASA